MTQANLAAHADSEWSGFWGGMRTAYDLFERNRLPPHVRVCNKQYVVSETASAEADGCADKDGEAAGKAARNTLYATPSLKTASRRRNARQAYAACHPGGGLRKRRSKPDRSGSADARQVVRQSVDVLIGHPVHHAVHAGVDPRPAAFAIVREA